MNVAFENLKEKLTSPPVLAFSDFETHFIMETDAFSAAVGSILAKKMEDGNNNLLQYESRTMNAAERKYYACER